ncbi:MAG: dGTP triphosphohydrolase [Myxococcota bacterium]
MLYSDAFRRLAGVTQVASPTEGRVLHNRLTHSLKVAQVGRALATRLSKYYPTAKIDPSVVETACLAHDLGHPPFGHVAEKKLDELVSTQDTDGFEGNPQSFRIVTRIERMKMAHPGLNLTRASLAAVIKYPWSAKSEKAKKSHKFGYYDADRADFEFAREGTQSNARTLEADIMDLADDITYSLHDLEDFYRAGLIPLHFLAVNAEERARAVQWMTQTQKVDFSSTDARDVLDRFAEYLRLLDVVEAYNGSVEQRAALRTLTSKFLVRYTIETKVDEDNKLKIDDGIGAEIKTLKALIWYYVISRPGLASQQIGHRRVIECLFESYFEALGSEGLANPVAPRWARKLVEENEELRSRVAADLVCLLTDRQAILLSRRFSGVDPGGILDHSNP